MATKATSSAPVEPAKKHTVELVKIFVRLAPVKYGTPRNLTRQLGDKTLMIREPDNSNIERHYLLNGVLSSAMSQHEIFKIVGQSKINGLASGKSSVVFVHGNKGGSGKKYTLNGDGSLANCGLVQQSLDYLFKLKRNQLAPHCLFQPNGENGFVLLDPMELALARVAEAKRRAVSSLALLEDEPYRKDQMKSPAPEQRCSFFVSFLQLYKNSIFDVLATVPDDQNPKPLVLCQDEASGEIYVKGLHEVEIRSAAEGMALFVRGKQQHHINISKLNAESSQSHIVFNIRMVNALMQKQIHGGHYKLVKGNSIAISRLAIVDLAGQECPSNGQRLTLNKSLEALRRCLADRQPDEVPPYEDSKLTKLFCQELMGLSRISLVICINPIDKYVQQNMQILKFAKQIDDVLVSERAKYSTTSRLISIALKQINPTQPQPANSPSPCGTNLSQSARSAVYTLQQRQEQQSLIKQKEEEVRNAIGQINLKNNHLTHDNKKLIHAYRQQRKIVVNLERKLIKRQNLIDELMDDKLEALREKGKLLDCLDKVKSSSSLLQLEFDEAADKQDSSGKILPDCNQDMSPFHIARCQRQLGNELRNKLRTRLALASKF